MGDNKDLRALIERAVAEALDTQLAALRQSVAQAVLAELEPVLAAAPAAAPADAAPPAAAGGGSAVLDAAVSSIHDGGAQADILRALLDGAANFCGRTALLISKGGQLNGWQSRGFSDEGPVKRLSLDNTRGLAGRAVQDRTPAAAAAAEFDSAFIAAVGNPADGNAVVLPLVVKDKVVAVLYADAGSAGRIDTSALQLLVRSTGHWLELTAFRKAGAPSAEPAPVEMHAAPPASPPEPASAPVAFAAAAPEPPPPPAPVAAPPPLAPATPADQTGLSPEDAEVHKKAKRFAKLLVDEIKLYNQAKVAEGRKHKDLYDRLKEDIDKSRATYDKRFGSTVAAGADYFNSEVVRILAENDSSLLGANYSR